MNDHSRESLELKEGLEKFKTVSVPRAEPGEGGIYGSPDMVCALTEPNDEGVEKQGRKTQW